MKKITLFFTGALIMVAAAIGCNDRGADDTNNRNSAPPVYDNDEMNRNDDDRNNNGNNTGTQDNINDETQGGDDMAPNQNRNRMDSVSSGNSSYKKR